MKEISLTNQEKLCLLKKTKEIYVKQYIECVLNSKSSDSILDEPLGLCGCFYQAREKSGYFNDDSFFRASNIIPEWNRIIAYQVNGFDLRKCQVYSSLNNGYWFPIWDNVSRVYFLNWLIDKYTEISINH